MSYPVDIPDQVKQAHLTGRLVIFCGAGISLYTNLKLFRGLVEDVIADCGKPLSTSKKTAVKPYERAYHENQPDKALGLLVSNEGIPSDVMRGYVKDRLTRPLPISLKKGTYVHKAILNLAAQPSGGYLLVTTNFDDRFEIAKIDKKWIHDAPRLAPPRRGQWRHATFLHGRIGDHDPENAQLVLTGQDFGNAYLRDAWAAKFVVELFREFTVLFIGYSVNDPVMGYLVDALAADNRFNKAYALAGYNSTNSSLKHESEEWEAKGIQLIPFDKGKSGRNYKPLYDTLESWSRLSMDPFLARLQEILGTTSKPYGGALPFHELRHLAWCLIDPKVAKAFADAAIADSKELGSNDPRLSWLEPLSEVKVYPRTADEPFKLFSMPYNLDTNDFDKPSAISAPLVGLSGEPELSEVTWQLMRWLLENLDKIEVVEWVIKRGGIIHPTFEKQIRFRMETLPGPYKSFWELVISGAFVRLDHII